MLQLSKLFGWGRGISCIAIPVFNYVIKIRRYNEPKDTNTTDEIRQSQSAQHFDQKLEYIQNGNLSYIPKIYYYNQYIIIEERLRVLEEKEFHKHLREIQILFFYFRDCKADNFGFNRKGKLLALDYTINKTNLTTKEYQTRSYLMDNYENRKRTMRQFLISPTFVLNPYIDDHKILTERNTIPENDTFVPDNIAKYSIEEIIDIYNDIINDTDSYLYYDKFHMYNNLLQIKLSMASAHGDAILKLKEIIDHAYAQINYQIHIQTVMVGYMPFNVNMHRAVTEGNLWDAIVDMCTSDNTVLLSKEKEFREYDEKFLKGAMAFGEIISTTIQIEVDDEEGSNGIDCLIWKEEVMKDAE